MSSAAFAFGSFRVLNSICVCSKTENALRLQVTHRNLLRKIEEKPAPPGLDILKRLAVSCENVTFFGRKLADLGLKGSDRHFLVFAEDADVRNVAFSRVVARGFVLGTRPFDAL